MIPIQLQIEGFLSYRKRTTIDFTQIRVACISGSNGAGKSALLDAMTWALFGEARKNDDALINDSQSVDKAEVVFDFEYESNTYRVVRGKEKGKTSTADLLVWQADDAYWKPLSEKTVRLTNKYIVDLLHLDYETFINASFFLQGKADQFTSQNASNRKQILSNILELDVWESYQKAAAEKRREQTSRMVFLEARRDELERELAQEPERLQTLKELEERLETVIQSLNQKQQDWQNAKAAETLLDARNAAFQTLKENLSRSGRQLESEQKRLSERKLEAEGLEQLLDETDKIEKKYQELLRIRTELAQSNEKASKNFKLAVQINELTGLIGQAQTRLESERQSLLQEQKRLESACLNISNLQHEQTQLQQKLDQLQQILDVKEELNAAVKRVSDALLEKGSENKHLKERMTEIKGRIVQLEQAEIAAPCPFCGQELDEVHTHAYLDDMNAEGKSLGDQFRHNTEEVERLKQEKSALEEKNINLQRAETQTLELTRRLAPITAELQTIEAGEPRRVEIAERLKGLETALQEKRYAESEQKQLAALQTEQTALAYDQDMHAKLKQQEEALADSEQKWQEVQRAKAALQPIQRETAELELRIEQGMRDLEQLNAQADQLQAELENLTTTLPDARLAKQAYDVVQAESNRIRLDYGAAKQQVAVLDTLKSQRKETGAEIEKVNLNISRLRYLEQAFSKNGIPAVLIEQALPEIQEHANTILGRLTEERMSVRFATQEDYKDKSREDKKETLAIFISDETGTREYEMFSGGEAFRVNFAIRLALSRILTRRAGSRLQMLVIDEGFGSQDAEGRQRLIEAITAVQDDYEKILVITHLDELKDIFPSRIKVEKTLDGSQVKVLP
jgi:exonuclease SbcC